MDSGRGSPGWLPAGWLAAIVVPLVLLVGLPADVRHEEHEDHRECAVCHAGHQTADLARPAEFGSFQTSARIEQAPEVRRAVPLRLLRRPARAPPA